MNEFDLLKEIYKASSGLPERVTIGPGDDMGELVIRQERLLCAVDQLIVGRHVETDTPPRTIGRKAIARCFSDIAAMAGTPTACLLTACIPPDSDKTWTLGVFEGAREAAKQWGGPIIGGDIATSVETVPVFTVTALAVPPTSGAIKRSGSHVGDYVCVTGEFGNSIMSHHLTFTPRIIEAQNILDELGSDLHAMIDVSDGLGRDASHLTSKRIQLQLDTSTIPRREGATIHHALADGEDYELLFTTSRIPNHSLVTVIGKVTARTKDSPAVLDEFGNDVSMLGWEHS